MLLATSVKLAEVKAAFPELTVTYTQLKPETVTTFVFGSAGGKSITNAVFECNFDFTKVSETTYKITAQDNETITFTFKCDNHVDYSNSYLVAGTRTQNYSVTYIPLRTIRVKVYNQSVYLQGATVVVNGKKLTSDANGYVTYRGGEAVSGMVEAFGYAGNTFSFSTITSDTTNTVEVYAAVEVKFVVKDNLSALVQGATVACGNEQGVTNLYGECILLLGKGTYEYKVTHADYFEKSASLTVGTSGSTVNVSLEPTKVDLKFVVKDLGGLFIDGATITCNGLTGTTDTKGEYTIRVDSKQKHNYTIVKYGFFDFIGEETVNIYAVTTTVDMTFNTEMFKPVENGNIQMLLCGTDAVLTIESTTVDYVIDWGDGTTDSASGTGSQTYNHTYTTTGNYQVEVRDCANVSRCNGNRKCLVAYWSIGNSNVSYLLFTNFNRLGYVGLIFRNDTKRTDFNGCFSFCSQLTSIPSGLFDCCTAVTTFYACFYSCYQLTSIPSGLFDNCTAVTNFGRCFYSCYPFTSIPSDLFKNCTAVTNLDECFNSCRKLTSIPSDLFKNCTVATSFYQCFSICVQLTSIPSGLFDNCTAATDFNGCFGSCGQLTSIPSGLFDNCTAATNFNRCFGSCSKLTSIPSGLFDNCTAVTDFRQCFNSCMSLTSIPSGLFDNCTAVTNFGYCFFSCSQLTSIPSGLFDNCMAVTHFDQCFGSCGQLTSIPSELFDNCTAVANFRQCFNLCINVTSDLPRLWIQYYGKTVSKESCFTGCTKAANWLEVTISWGGTAPEYVPPVATSGVMMADYRALEARIRNIEVQQNMDKN